MWISMQMSYNKVWGGHALELRQKTKWPVQTKLAVDFLPRGTHLSRKFILFYHMFASSSCSCAVSSHTLHLVSCNALLTLCVLLNLMHQPCHLLIGCYLLYLLFSPSLVFICIFSHLPFISMVRKKYMVANRKNCKCLFWSYMLMKGFLFFIFYFLFCKYIIKPKKITVTSRHWRGREVIVGVRVMVQGARTRSGSRLLVKGIRIEHTPE